MPELTREEKLKLIEKLPQRLQEFLYSEDTGAALLYLGQKYNLPDEKVHLLSKLVGNVVLGIVPITSLAQEINSKITSDAQAAMNLAQELNTELLAPAMVSIPPRPIAPPTAPTPARPADEYREPTPSVPEVVDLRKTPPSPAEAGYGGQRPPVDREGGLPLGLPVAPALTPKPVMPSLPPKPIAPTQPIAPKPVAPPLTFTRSIEPAPALIEAEPHKILTPTSRPQYIMRPSGAPPTDIPENVLDLRKDKGEF